MRRHRRVGQGGDDLLAIDDLTEGEALWMGGRVSELLEDSLSKAGTHQLPATAVHDPSWDHDLDQ